MPSWPRKEQPSGRSIEGTLLNQNWTSYLCQHCQVVVQCYNIPIKEIQRVDRKANSKCTLLVTNFAKWCQGPLRPMPRVLSECTFLVTRYIPILAGDKHYLLFIGLLVVLGLSWILLGLSCIPLEISWDYGITERSLGSLAKLKASSWSIF